MQSQIGASIEIKSLRVWLGQREVIRGISLSIPSNTVFTIMGPSGSGKSTLSGGALLLTTSSTILPEMFASSLRLSSSLDIF